MARLMVHSAPMPPPPGIAGFSFFGSSATLGLGGDEQAGDGCRALQCRAHHLVGSMMPFDIMLTYSPDCASKPKPQVSFSRILLRSRPSGEGSKPPQAGQEPWW